MWLVHLQPGMISSVVRCTDEHGGGLPKNVRQTKTCCNPENIHKTTVPRARPIHRTVNCNSGLGISPSLRWFRHDLNLTTPANIYPTSEEPAPPADMRQLIFDVRLS